MAFMSGDMSTTVNIGGNSLGLQAAVDQAVTSLNALGVRMDEMSAQGESTGFAMGNLGKVFTESGFSLNGLLETMGVAGGPVGALTGLVGQLTGGIGDMIEQAISFVGAMAGWAIIQTVIGWVQQLSDELFNLQVQTQRLDTGWQYLLGGGPQSGGVQASQNMMQWTSQFSMGIPFTRQDLMSAVTTLAASGLNTQQIEQFMPYLSDIAATYGSAAYGGKGVDLQQAANAVRMAQQGLSRMLKYDLNLNPEELVPYGLKMDSKGHITDPNSIYRALENFANAKGVAGASGNIVNQTWWGGWSSLTDQMQNFLLQVGGTNLNGTINPGSFFGTLQQALDGLLKWFNEHQDEIKTFADTVSHLLGDVTKVGGGLLGQFVDELNKLGAVQWLEGGISNLDKLIQQWFGLNSASYDPKHPMGHRQQLADQYNQQGLPQWVQQLTDAVGKLASISWTGINAFFSALAANGPQMAQDLSLMAQSMATMGSSITPSEAKMLDDLATFFGGQLGQGMATNLFLIDVNLQGMALALQAISPFIPVIEGGFLQLYNASHNLGDALQTINDELQKLPKQLPPWLTGGLLQTPAGQSAWNGYLKVIPGFLQGGFNPTNTPGGWRQFGMTGVSGGLW